jgi:hypothetical protein
MGMKTKLHDMVSALKKLAKSLDKTPTVVEFMKETGISNRSIYDNGSYEDLCVKAGLQLHKEPLAVEARPPKILFIDIETAPIKAYAYGIWDQNISAQQIIKDWFMISWAARWLGEEEVMYADSRKRKDVSNDKAICKKIHKLLCEADIIDINYGLLAVKRTWKLTKRMKYTTSRILKLLRLCSISLKHGMRH